MKLWIRYDDESGDYHVSRRKPTKGDGLPSCGMKDCTSCPESDGYYHKGSFSALCNDDFEMLMGKGFRKGLHHVEVKKIKK